ncbi:MAG: Sulfotransferase domain, partial [Ilumatobacteraceae bacterium]
TEWQQHLERVRAYFAGRENFVEIDISDNPMWRPLCELLGVPEPNVAFPLINRDPAPH